jgi:hypothetical protein
MAEEEKRDRLSADLMNKFRNQRKLRRKQVARDVAAGIGAGAESFRTGKSAQGVFQRWKPDYSGQMMSKKEKMERSQDIYKAQERSEQYYFGEARRTAEARARTLAGNRTAKQQRAMDTARRKDNATFRRTQQIINTQNNTVRNNLKQQKMLETPSDGAKAYFADMPTYEQRVEADAREVLKAMKSNGTDTEWKEAMGIPPDATDKRVLDELKKDPSIRKDATAEAKADSKRRIESMAAGNPQDKDLVWAVNEAAKKSGTDPADIQSSLDPEAKAKTQEADIQHTEDIENINDENEVIDGKFERERRKLYQSDTETGEVSEDEPGLVGEGKRTPGSAEIEAGKIGASRLEEIEDVDPNANRVTSEDLTTTEDLLREKQQEQIEAIGQDGQPQEEQQGFLGFSDIKRPGPGAQAHFRSLLEVIEKYPESRPAQHAKAQIMATQEFKDYQKKNFNVEGGDPEIVWREMTRDYRKQNREDNEKMRAAKRSKRLNERQNTRIAMSPKEEAKKRRVSNMIQGSEPADSQKPSTSSSSLVST